MINQDGDPYVVAMVPSLDVSYTGHQRYFDLALPALNEALDPLNNLPGNVRPIPVIIGLPEDRPGLPDDLSKILEERIIAADNGSAPIGNVRTVSKGHSAGLMALETGSKVILQRASEFCVIGGVDSYTDPDTLDWVEDNEQLHKPSNAWGFLPGEAAAFCLICSRNTAQKYNLPIRTQLVAISTALEKNKIKTKTVCIGEGLTQAVRNAFQTFPREFRIDFTICDQNGEAYRADEFGFMLARMSEYFVDPSDFMAPADIWGDVGAASGPLYINLIACAAEKGYFKGPHTLLWTSSEGGERSAAILRADNKEVRAS
ncbi:MAG: beta-ketoacyl synthase N-terminal-like domain-containing protein [Planctomycetota bacterium]|jgi:3-oxoacyl-[acyl-carrier-protein] synthase-1